jgi:hypothetical protein
VGQLAAERKSFHGRAASLQSIAKDFSNQLQAADDPRGPSSRSTQRGESDHSNYLIAKNQGYAYMGPRKKSPTSLQVARIFRGQFFDRRKYDRFSCLNPVLVPWENRAHVSIHRQSTQALAAPSMRHNGGICCVVNASDGTAVKIQREHDLLEPMIDFAIYFVRARPHEPGGQLAYQLLESGGFCLWFTPQTVAIAPGLYRRFGHSAGHR